MAFYSTDECMILKEFFSKLLENFGFLDLKRFIYLIKINFCVAMLFEKSFQHFLNDVENWKINENPYKKSIFYC